MTSIVSSLNIPSYLERDPEVQRMVEEIRREEERMERLQVEVRERLERLASCLPQKCWSERRRRG